MQLAIVKVSVKMMLLGNRLYRALKLNNLEDFQTASGTISLARQSN